MVREVKLAVRRERPWYRKDGTVAAKPRVEYQCAACQQWHQDKNIQVDHINEVVDIQAGFVDWNTFIERLYCSKDNLQVLCKPCHQIKTNAARALRSAHP